MPLLICSNGVANWVIQKVLPAAGTQLCRAQPALQARTPQHREFLCPLPCSQLPPQPVCAIPKSSGPLSCLRLTPGSRNAAERCCSVSWGSPFPVLAGNIACRAVFLTASQALPNSHLHSSTSQWDFPRLFWAQQQLCCHFWDVWIWVCTEDPRAGHYLDFAHWMSVLCSRAHFALSIILFFCPQLTVLPPWTPWSGLHQTHFPGKTDFQL